MGILKSEKQNSASTTAPRRKSMGLDLSSLKPLEPKGIKNFAGYRDPAASAVSGKSKSKNADDEMDDSDADDEDEQPKAEDNDDDIKDDSKGLLSPEDALRQGELAEGVRKIRVRLPLFFPVHSFLFRGVG